VAIKQNILINNLVYSILAAAAHKQVTRSLVHPTASNNKQFQI